MTLWRAEEQDLPAASGALAGGRAINVGGQQL